MCIKGTKLPSFQWHLHSEAFFVERKRLLELLDNQLTSFTKKSIGFPDPPKLKTALGISSRSLVTGRPVDHSLQPIGVGLPTKPQNPSF